MKAVREAVNRVARDHTFELMRESEATPELVAQLNAISDEWRDGARRARLHDGAGRGRRGHETRTS